MIKDTVYNNFTIIFFFKFTIEKTNSGFGLLTLRPVGEIPAISSHQLSV